MPGLKVKGQTPQEIMSLVAPDFEWSRPDWAESFVIEEGSPDGEEEEMRYTRQANKFVKKMRRREARLRAKGRIA